MILEQQRLCVELQRLDWARTLSEEVIQELVAAAEAVQFQTGQTVLEYGAETQHIYFLISGRLAGGIFDRLGKEIYHDVLGRGAVLGLFSALLPDRSHLQVEALEPTLAIRLTLDQLLQLTSRHKEFQLAMFRVAANLVKQLVMVDRDLPRPATVGVLHHGPASRSVSGQLARRLRALGETPCVAGDEGSEPPGEGIPFRSLFEKGQFIGAAPVTQLLQDWVSRGRLLIDLSAEHQPEELQRLMSYADVVLWCVRPQDVPAAIKALTALESSSPRLREKVRIVWILDSQSPTPPYVAEFSELAARDFKVWQGQPRPHQGKLLQQGIERIVHHLRGVQIGLALGGGAARGMAHLGVLKALEQHGVFVDMLAGASAGAMTGTLYAAGLDPEYTSQCFKKDLLPPWFFRQLPGSGYWYLLYKYRRHQFGPMLRKYLDHLQSEQLAIPAYAISVDLVDGTPLVRETGDATHNILESINLPPLALPILRSEQAVVDGGLLNNVPANVLVSKGCNFVIASTVTAKLEKDFMGIRSKKARGAGRFLSTLQVVMRQNLIQSYSMNAEGVKPADFVIAPDVTAFDLSEFTRADEMAVVGELATNEGIRRLKGMLAKLDPMLFG